RATALLAWAADTARRSLITVCVQREGGLARADRLPLRGDEQHLPPAPRRGSAGPVRERGCGDAVSATPPSAVVAAAELGAALARAELTLERALPATIVRVLDPQPDSPYQEIATLVPPSTSQRGPTA